MEHSPKRLLVIALAPEVFTCLPPLLWRSAFDVSTPSDPELALRAIARTRYSLIVTAYPLPGVGFQRFLDDVRAFGSPNRGTALLAIAAPSRLEEARKYVGRGLNRAASSTAPLKELAATVAELLEVQPRISVRAPLTITLVMRQRQRTLLTQTVNISSSGMLVQADGRFRVGERLAFELKLPGATDPLIGELEVARLAHRTTGKPAGIGVRFVSMTEASRAELGAYLDRCLRSGSSPAESS